MTNTEPAAPDTRPHLICGHPFEYPHGGACYCSGGCPDCAPDTHSGTRSEFEEEMTRAAYAYEGRYPKKDAPARRHGFAEGARWAKDRAAGALQEARERAERFAETERRREEKTPTIEAARDEVWEYAGRYIPDGTAIHGLKTPLAKLNAAYWLEVERAEAEVVALRDDNERLRARMVEFAEWCEIPGVAQRDFNILADRLRRAAEPPAASRPVPGNEPDGSAYAGVSGKLPSPFTRPDEGPPAPTPVVLAENAEPCGCVGHGHGGYHPGTCSCCDTPPVVPNEEVRE